MNRQSHNKGCVLAEELAVGLIPVGRRDDQVMNQSRSGSVTKRDARCFFLKRVINTVDSLNRRNCFVVGKCGCEVLKS